MVVLIAASSAGLAVTFLIAPMILVRANGFVSDSDLTRMSETGQAYGSLSALLSGAATGAVAAALLLQIRQMKISRAQAIRTIQIQLMSMILEHPELRPVSPTLNDVSADQRSRDIYTNLMLRYLEMGYEVGHFSAASVRTELRNQFAIDDIRRFWSRTRIIQLSGIINNTQREFAQMAEEAYQNAAVDPEIPKATASAKPARSTQNKRYRRTLYAAIGGITMTIATQKLISLINRRRRYRSLRHTAPRETPTTLQG